MNRLRFGLVNLLAALVGVLIAVVAVAHADDQIFGLDSVYWSISQSFAASSNTACVIRRNGSAACALFPAGEGASAKSVGVEVKLVSGTAACCWAGINTLSTTAIGTTFEITDADGPYGSGQGACFRLDAIGQVYVGRPRRAALTASHTPGTTTGICDTALTGENASLEPTAYPMCEATADCTTASAGTCISNAAIVTGLASASPRTFRAQVDNAAIALWCRSPTSVAFEIAVSKGAAQR